MSATVVVCGPDSCSTVNWVTPASGIGARNAALEPGLGRPNEDLLHAGRCQLRHLQVGQGGPG